MNICIEENTVVELIVEAPNIMADICEDIHNQMQGYEGRIVLSENEKVLKLSKYADTLWNPFAIDCNDRKIVNKIYQDINEVAMDEYYEATSNINSRIVEYLDILTNSMVYDLDYDLQLDIVGLCKLYRIGIQKDDATLANKIINYMRTYSKVLGIKFFILMNIKMYLSKEELQEIYKFANYEKIVLFLISGTQLWRSDEEKAYICDKDMCIIDV